MQCREKHFHYNKPSSSSLLPGCCFCRRATPGFNSRSRVSPPVRPHRFHKPMAAQAAPAKSMMPLGHLTKGASWEELIQTCVRSFGESTLTVLGARAWFWRCEMYRRNTSQQYWWLTLTFSNWVSFKGLRCSAILRNNYKPKHLKTHPTVCSFFFLHHFSWHLYVSNKIEQACM